MNRPALHPHSVPVTVFVAARNEALNIARCVEALKPARRVVVLDSHSTDRTAELASALGAEVIQFSYQGGHPKKRQWALDTVSIETPWVLLLDADEVVTPELWMEIAEALELNRFDAFLIRKGFHFMGRRFRYGGFSHQAVLLFRRGKARFEQLLEADQSGLDMEVHERVIVDGPIGCLRQALIHEDFKGLDAYIARHNAYAVWEAALRRRFLDTGRYGELAITPRLFGNAQERRRWLKKVVIRLPFEPAVWFVVHFLLKGAFLEGKPGFIASKIRAQYIASVRAKMKALPKLRLNQKTEFQRTAA